MSHSLVRSRVRNYLETNPDGYCPDHGTGVACPVGLGVLAEK
jgi:hypothetical protein